MAQNEHINESILSDEVRQDMKKERIDHMTYLPGMEVLDSDIGQQVLDRTAAYDYNRYTAEDVRRALRHENRTLEDFGALLSPAALPLLEEIAQVAQQETRKHFGNSVCMFTPLYIANYCENYCIYCGFNCHNKIHRAQLNAEQIEKEMEAIAATGLQEILILTGESRSKSTVCIHRRGLQNCAQVFQGDRPGSVSDELRRIRISPPVRRRLRHGLPGNVQQRQI